MQNNDNKASETSDDPHAKLRAEQLAALVAKVKKAQEELRKTKVMVDAVRADVIAENKREMAELTRGSYHRAANNLMG